MENRWNLLKSERLKKTRGVSFDEIIKGKLIDIISHPVYQNQNILVYEWRGYL